MKKSQFINFIESLENQNVNITLQTKSGKWYEQEYTNDFETIEPSKIYGISFNDHCIDFDFKAGKKVDNFFKSFVTQYINKYLTKQPAGLKDGCIFYPDKKECLNKLKNQNRVHKYYFYTTLYGIGWFSFLSSNKVFTEVNGIMRNHLKGLNIPFKNEYSEAGWVFRFLINKDVKIHNTILKDLNI